MANVTENRVNAILTAADLAAITAAAATIGSKIPSITLTDDERLTYLGMDVDNKVFVEDCISEMGIVGPGVLPAFMTPALIQTDLTLYEQMDEILNQLANLTQRAEDVKRVAGSEGYGMATAVYNNLGLAAKYGLPNTQQAHDKLKVRFVVKTGATKQVDTKP